MKKTAFLPILATAAALLTSSAAVSPGAVVPGDTFSLDLYAGGPDSDGNKVSYNVIPNQDVVFGTTNTYADLGFNGQDVTISSSEVIGATTTNDTITISTPVTFVTTDTYQGITISVMTFRICDDFTGGDVLSLQRFTGILDLEGSITYSGGTLPLFPEFMLGQDLQSFTAHEFIFTSSDLNPPAID